MPSVLNLFTSSRFWTLVVILFHGAAAFLEIDRWEWISGRLVGFGTDMANQTWMLGFNQGLYNAFIAVGLALSLTAVFRGGAKPVRAYFLLCVVVWGCLGAWSLDYPLLAVAQAGPAVLALVAMFFRR